MDEETPHIHIDFVPFTRNSKRGLDTRVSLKSALADQGFRGGKRGSTEWNEWMESEKQELSKVMERYGIHWKKLGTHNKHLSVLDYEKQERTKEVAELDKQIETSEEKLKAVEKLTDDQFEQHKRLRESGKRLRQQYDELHSEKQELERINSETAQSNRALTEQNQSLIIQNEDLEGERERLESGNQELEKKNKKLKKELKSMEGTKNTLERDVRAYDEDKEWQLPEPGILTSARSYLENIAEPLAEKLKGRIKSLTLKYIKLLDDFKELKAWSERQSSQLEFCREKIEKQDALIDRLQEKADDLERVKRYSGEETIQDIINKTRAIDRQLEARREAERQAKRSINRGLIR
jgi:chromosome segregation ATPase